jgi:hypothetical protein
MNHPYLLCKAFGESRHDLSVQILSITAAMAWFFQIYRFVV